MLKEEHEMKRAGAALTFLTQYSEQDADMRSASQVAALYNARKHNLVPCYDKRLNDGGSYVE